MTEKELKKQEDQSGVTVSGFSAYSSTTPHYELPIVSGDDKYSPMTTWNGAMEKIDAGLYEAQTDADTNKDDIASIKNENDRQDNELNAIRTVDEVQTANIAKLMGSVNELKSTDQTILKDLVEQNAMVKALQNDVNDLEKSQDAQDLKLADVEGKIGGEGEEGTIQADIEANTAMIDAHYSGDLTTPYPSNKKLDEAIDELGGGFNAVANDVSNHWKSSPAVITNPYPNDKLTRSINLQNIWINNQPKTVYKNISSSGHENIPWDDLKNSAGDMPDGVFFLCLPFNRPSGEGSSLVFTKGTESYSLNFSASGVNGSVTVMSSVITVNAPTVPIVAILMPFYTNSTLVTSPSNI